MKILGENEVKTHQKQTGNAISQRLIIEIY
jgi:hypothetical protein